MTIAQFLASKRDGKPHTEDELRWFISELVAGRITDYQASAWLMAAYVRGLSKEETVALTLAMADSGERLSHPGLPHPVLDKHSTGGVGDAVTPIFLPIMAACGVPVIKMSGRGLGFTGGTIDKLESVPGFRTNLPPSQLQEIALRVGCALGGQTADLAPADKILYALRDATATIGSIPLIASSVMSKKLAAGADAIVLDVKAGNGAFMQTVDGAVSLAEELVSIGKGAGKSIRAFVTDMSQPLGPAVGNALEMRAAIRELKTGCKGRLGQLTLKLCNAALELAGKTPIAEDVVASGSALEKMSEWIQAQGGDSEVVRDDSLWPSANVRIEVTAETDGFVASFDTAALGLAANQLGAGRTTKESAIDLAVGIEVCKEIGDEVRNGDVLFQIHANDESKGIEAANAARNAIHISNEQQASPPLVHKELRS